MAERTIKAIVFTEPNNVEIGSFTLPGCGAEEVICETIYSFVSPGTELRVLGGFKESKGKFPLIPGYSWVGRVVEIGANVRGWSEGDLVTGRNAIPVPGIGSMWGGQVSHHRCPAGSGTILKLPDGADPWNYLPNEVAAIAWRGTSCAFPAAGETAVVIGQGLVGAFAARWLVWHGVRVVAVDLVASRLERALKWGASAVVNAADGDACERILTLLPGGADIVVEASSSRPGVELANAVLRQPGARLLNVNYPTTQLHANAHYWPRLVYLATYTHTHETEPGRLAGKGEAALVFTPSDRTPGDRLAVMERIRAGDLRMDEIVQEPTPLEQAPEAYLKLRDNPDKFNTIVFDWRTGKQ